MGSISKAYFERFSHFKGLYGPRQEPHPALQLSIVLPAYREGALAETLESLAQCALPEPNAVELLLVLNQAAQDRDSLPLHQEQGERWQGRILANGLKLRVLSALDLPPAQAGVGLARKIGMDEALARFDQVNFDGWVVNLDADCRVSADYLTSLLDHSRAKQLRGASIKIAHRLPADPHGRKAAIDYENWLRYYAAALRWSHYPHHHLTIGSAMAVRASVYAALGGMNRRQAAEDFYFLHKVMPGGAYASLKTPVVFPSARVSDRVPFGTGRGIAEQLAGKKDFTRVYAPEIFQNLQLLHQGQWQAAPPFWQDFLVAHAKIARSFQAFLQRTGPANEAAFFKWWDGFKVLKFVHFQSGLYPERPLPAALEALWGEPHSGMEALKFLRSLEA